MTWPIIVDASTLADHLSDSDILIVDLSSEENYLKAHIPGAIHLPSSRLLTGTGDIPNKTLSPQQLQTLCDEIGLTDTTQVVAYDDQKGPWAGRFIWTLHLAGHTQCSILNGQLNGWINSGLPLESTPNTATPTHYKLNPNKLLTVDIEQINSEINNPSTVIWDARSAEEYRGEKLINVKKGGHIPGAINMEWTDCLISDNDLRIKPAATLIKDLAAKGITPDKKIITHCQTHRRSGLTYIVARHLGFDNVRCYDGSWFEWGNNPDTLVEK